MHTHTNDHETNQTPEPTREGDPSGTRQDEQHLPPLLDRLADALTHQDGNTLAEQLRADDEDPGPLGRVHSRPLFGFD